MLIFLWRDTNSTPNFFQLSKTPRYIHTHQKIDNLIFLKNLKVLEELLEASDFLKTKLHVLCIWYAIVINPFPFTSISHISWFISLLKWNPVLCRGFVSCFLGFFSFFLSFCLGLLSCFGWSISKNFLEKTTGDYFLDIFHVWKYLHSVFSHNWC